MSGYTKNIAVIRGLKAGFSADGGELSGLVKAEKYGSNLKIEASLINFAPLTEGKYVCAVSDGKNSIILEGFTFDGASEVDTSDGFAALICFVNGSVSAIATAVCGRHHAAAIGLRDEIARQENAYEKPITEAATEKYEDEALAKENYYEYEQTVEGGDAVLEDTQKKDAVQNPHKDEEDTRAFKKGGLAGGGFYEKMKDEIERVLNSYPAEAELEGTVENSRWVKIDYGEGKYYVFGVIFGGGSAQYICYGVPSQNKAKPPHGFARNVSYIPTVNGGYWVTYQDAATGAQVDITAQ